MRNKWEKNRQLIHTECAVQKKQLSLHYNKQKKISYIARKGITVGVYLVATIYTKNIDNSILSL